MTFNKLSFFILTILFPYLLHGCCCRIKKEEASPQIQSLRNLRRYLSNDFSEINRIGYKGNIEEIRAVKQIKLAVKQNNFNGQIGLFEDEYIKPAIHIKETLLGLAARLNDCCLGSLLIGCKADVNQIDGEGQMPLHKAALHDKAEFVQFLIAQGADFQARDAQGQTPLMVAVQPARGAVIVIDRERDQPVVQKLIAAKAALDAQDPKGNTALLLAQKHRNRVAIQLLEKAAQQPAAAQECKE